MSSHYIELERLLIKVLGAEDFASNVAGPEVEKVRDLFRRRTVFESAESGGLSIEHELDALCRTMNAVIAVKDPSAGKIDEIQDAEEARLAWRFLAVVCGDEKMEHVVDDELSKAAVGYHYSTLRPRQFDIFVHLSGSEMFFIDGDSLLMAALSSPHVDWDLMQPLHVHHNAQALLYRLQSRGARFHIVFFDNQRWFWEKSPQKLLMRESLRLVLMEVAESNALCGFSVFNFPSFSSTQFVTHTETYDPEFILMSDGEQLGSPNWLMSMYHNTEVEVQQDDFKSLYRSLVDDEKVGEEVSLYYHCFLLWAQARNVKVAFSSRVVARENAVIVFTATVRSAQFSRVLLLEKTAVGLACNLEREVKETDVPSRAVEICEEADLYFREKVAVGAAYAFLHRDGATVTAAERELCLALVVTGYAMVYFDLPERAQRRPHSAGVTEFLNQISPYVLTVFQKTRSFWTGVEFDALDGHLLCAVAANLQERSVAELLGEKLLNDVEIAWVDVLGESKALLEQPLRTLPKVEIEESPVVRKCLHLDHPLVKELSKRLGVAAPEPLQAVPEGHGNGENLHGWKIVDSFLELNDVVDSQEEEKKEKNLTDRQRRRRDELETQFKLDAERQARSMGLSNFTNERLELVSGKEETKGKGDAKAKGQGGKTEERGHAGQKNKKAISRKTSINFANFVSSAMTDIDKWKVRVSELLDSMKSVKGRLEGPDGDNLHRLLRSALSELRNAKFEQRFDPGMEVSAQKHGEMPLRLYVWRQIVSLEAKEDESAFLRKIKELPGTTEKKGDTLIAKMVELGAKEPIKSVVPKDSEGVNYLFWVVLSMIRVHFSMQLMCAVLAVLLARWRVERENARTNERKPNIEIGIPVFIWCHHQILACLRDTGILLSESDLSVVRSALSYFDFPAEYYRKLEQFMEKWQGVTIQPFELTHEKVWKETPERTQLIHMGHKLERPVITEKDPRVGFNPDAWQRELLNIVDSGASAVVCAPTSAGKTFISYYSMLKALKTSNERMVAYVAPTRALINQAVVDVCARYGSKIYQTPGKNVYGILGGGDYHRYHKNCQVIITLPEVLETLLMSPEYRDVASKLDYVILDEIHTMESSGNGDVWERVLALLPCPFVALSATLGQTDRLCAWLNRVQQRLHQQDEKSPEGEKNKRERDYTVYNVPSSTEPIQRWNDIKKYIYLPPANHKPEMKKVTSEYKHRFIQDLHPLSILTIEQIRNGFPPDISLVPSEVVELYDQMSSRFEKFSKRWEDVIKVMQMKAQLLRLKPEMYFKAVTYITQRHARQYESDVKFALVQWVNLTWESDIGRLVNNKRVALSEDEVKEFQTMIGEECKGILSAFSVKLHKEENSLKDEAMRAVEEQVKGTNVDAKDVSSLFPDSKQFLASNIISVLRELGSRSMGPTIVFSFETQDCDDLVNAVLEELEQRENDYRETSEYLQSKAKRRAAAQRTKERLQQEESSKKQKRTKDAEGDAMRGERRTDELYELDALEAVEPDVLDEFTFLRRVMNKGAFGSDIPQYEQSTVNAALASCRDHGDRLARRAIQRGIGIHHAGVKGKIRRDMEVLFRTGYSGVIFATETLALGIHSPCRSVVLAGDHVLLNPTQFRQMMGRAGRRGLDDLGHLVFFGVSIKKITRLMTSGITVIKGNVQMDAISLLRILQLYELPQQRLFLKKKMGEWSDKMVEQWRSFVTALAERLFTNPLFYAGVDACEEKNMEPLTLGIFRMLLGYFHREGLYNTVKPSALGSLLVDAMHVFRNAGVGAEGFAFMNLLTNGVLEEADFPATFHYLDSKVHNSGRRAEAVAELLAYLFSMEKMCNVPLEIHRSALSDPVVLKLWDRKSGSKQHRVVLAPLKLLNPHGIVQDYTRAYSVISGFFKWLSTRLKNPSSKRLYYMNSQSRRVDPMFGAGVGANVSFPLRERLLETKVEYSARHPLVAISGCGDSFVNMEDLCTTLREGLFCDPRMLPLYDFTDGCRHDGAQVLINACLSDFIRCQAERNPVRTNTFRFTQLERLNGLTQSEAYAVLNHAEVVLGNIAGPRGTYEVIQKLYPEGRDSEELAGADLVVEVAQALQGLREQIG